MEFIDRHRRSPSDFIHNRKLSFSHTVPFVLNFPKGAVKFELDGLFAAGQKLGVALREVTKSVFSKARKKLRYEAFVELNERVIEALYVSASIRCWTNFRVVAVDGSDLRLPNTDGVRCEFESLDDQVPRSRIVELHVVLNHITLAARYSSPYMGERFHAEQLLDHPAPGGLALSPQTSRQSRCSPFRRRWMRRPPRIAAIVTGSTTPPPSSKMKHFVALVAVTEPIRQDRAEPRKTRLRANRFKGKLKRRA